MNSVDYAKQIIENERANDVYKQYISIKERQGENVEALILEQADMLRGNNELAKKALEIYSAEINEYYESLKK